MARVNPIVIIRCKGHDAAMKRFTHSTLAAAIFLAACSPLNTYYKPGASVTALNRDTTTCQVKALRDVPTSTQVRRIPPEYVPPERKCDSNGDCHIIRSGYFIPGEIITFDPNDGLRRRVEGQCMAEKGYAPVSIPPCPDSIARATPARATTRLPTLTQKSCVIRNQDGTFQIVTRG
ncbi:MAG: hypothetical protein WBB25_17105 [Sulfitobacter sp.]